MCIRVVVVVSSLRSCCSTRRSYQYVLRIVLAVAAAIVAIYQHVLRIVLAVAAAIVVI